MSVILSNRSWFKRYVWLRNSIIFGTLIAFAAHFFRPSPLAWLEPVLGVLSSFFLLIIIFEILQKPGLLEVRRGAANTLDIALYLPNTKTFFYLDERRVRRFTVHPQDRLELLGELKALPWRQQLQIVVSKPGGQRFQSEVLDVSWAAKADLKRFFEVAQGYGKD